MDKLVFIIILIFSSNFVVAQDFNLDFENWTNTGQFYNPSEWDSSNETFMIGTFVPVTKESSAYNGTYAVELKSTFISQVGSTLIGVITLGDFEVNTYTQKAKVSGGKPYTKRPSKLTGYYKYSPNTTDSCGILIDLFKYNSSTSDRDTIGSGILTSGEVLDWTYFEVPINYVSSENPDSFNIIALSSDTSDIKPESTLWLDKLTLFEESAIDENDLQNSLLVYPNPTNGELNIKFKNNLFEDITIQLIDIFGKVLFCDYITRNQYFQKNISLQKYSAGLYFISLKSKEYSVVRKIEINGL
ncbi:MAG TPA: hypothetical protein DDX39_00405 [Bacteroidales bacterium]|nr:MAG: hypothetical protein A2W98_03150 [Bacteroidetes bacterium GWF2_33_38]OFY91877.1 MAG: hypothetical protein A2236_04850 [Bacteroidetes bacterium RIFOXYA2_FULL_33_7]HBF87071.1 hypothetical protein [Bacteroidales bacterium]